MAYNYLSQQFHIDSFEVSVRWAIFTDRKSALFTPSFVKIWKQVLLSLSIHL